MAALRHLKMERRTTNDADGSCRLNAPANGRLVFSFIGLASQEIAIGNQSTIAVSLAPDASNLDELIVTTFGTAKRASFTGSAGTLSPTQLQNCPVNNLAQALSGATSGVQTTAGNGQPDTAPDIRIRDFGSISSGNAPLYVVDGIPYSGNIANISPNDIENISVLKDAASMVLYGARDFNSTNIRVDPKVINSVLYDQIPATDVRSKMWVKVPTAANSVVPTGGVRVAYMTQKFRLPGTPSTSTMGDVPYMRVAEMYLIEAKAQTRQGNTAATASVLFDLVSKRDPSYKLSTKTGTALMDEILFNRRIELWGEGFRFTDLKRMNLPLNRNGANLSSAVVVLFDVPAGDNQWEFLIPRREINTNKAIVQNPL